MTLRVSESIAVAYFAYLAGTALLSRRVGRGARLRVIVTASAVVVTIVGFGQIGMKTAVWRDWMPLVYVLLGYWLPGLLVTDTNQKLERALLALDRRLGVQDGFRSPLLELAYLFCYPMVPLGLASLYAAGLRGESDRFWTAIFLAVFACYGLLPLLPTRPPRAIEGESTPPTSSSGAIRRLNLKVLGKASIQLNTFPSGHAAASVATALAVGARLPVVGLALGVLALGIAVGSVTGRYHYAADAVTGVALGFAGFFLSRFL
jgi:membrane-associated phospholipid phosphatase